MKLWIGIIGVALGFLLGEGSRWIRYKFDIWSKKRLILAELKTVLSQIPQKVDILTQAIEHMKQNRFMPLMSVHMVTTGYYAVLEVVYPHLSQVERNCLHVIFERIRITEILMDDFENSFVVAKKDGVISDVIATYIGRLEEVLESFKVIEDLANSYLSKKPIDVFYINNKHKG